MGSQHPSAMGNNSGHFDEMAIKCILYGHKLMKCSNKSLFNTKIPIKSSNDRLDDKWKELHSNFLTNILPHTSIHTNGTSYNIKIIQIPLKMYNTKIFSITWEIVFEQKPCFMENPQKNDDCNNNLYVNADDFESTKHLIKINQPFIKHPCDDHNHTHTQQWHDTGGRFITS